jgi:hypothetical protein
MPRGRVVQYPVAVGDVFGHRMVIGPAEPLVGPDGRPRTRWMARCECGTVDAVLPQNLRTGSQCEPCRRGEMIARNHRGAGIERGHDANAIVLQPEFGSWKAMRARCYNPSNARYADYGGRGIRVCDAWRSSFAAFLRDVGRRPSADHSIDRIDVNGDYEPSNVRWATRSEQQRNRRDAVMITLGSVTKHIRDWVEERGLDYERVRGLLRRGVAPEEALRQ